ncbi:MAG TPA: hypothetical protein VFT71_00775 [Candidatus Nitrosocosmicus sp.]|nr:hypothetical protein [Candidatus Nitrosocosmicus sp.]
MIKVEPEYIGLWVAIEPENRDILALSISKERNMFVAERFLDGLIKIQGKHCEYTDEGGTWYPDQAYRFLKLRHHIHSSLEKSLIERTMQYLKDRIKNCKLKHVSNWLDMFSDYHNKEVINT